MHFLLPHDHAMATCSTDEFRPNWSGFRKLRLTAVRLIEAQLYTSTYIGLPGKGQYMRVFGNIQDLFVYFHTSRYNTQYIHTYIAGPTTHIHRMYSRASEARSVAFWELLGTCHFVERRSVFVTSPQREFLQSNSLATNIEQYRLQSLRTHI